jgi:hypothetical protein
MQLSMFDGLGTYTLRRVFLSDAVTALTVAFRECATKRPR